MVSPGGSGIARPEVGCGEVGPIFDIDDLQPMRRTFLTQRVGELPVDGLNEICLALRALADC
jgi:hypothetical protein